MTSAASESSIRKQRVLAAKDRATDREVVMTLMSLPNGRRWMWNLLAECGIFHGAENLEHSSLAFREGKRVMGLRLLASVTSHTPEMYVRMTQENSPVPLKDFNDEEAQDAQDE